MKNVILIAVLVTFILSFIGYGKENEEVKTVEYYKKHETDRKIKIKECKNNPGELRGTPNCVNALAAHRTGGIKPDPRTATDAKQFDKF